MKVYQLYRRQELAMSLSQAWPFFTSPYNLNAITPDFFHVDIISPVPQEIYGGLLICYRMRAVFGLPMTWLSEITQCDAPKRFVYQQKAGPFKFWSHEVCLSPSDQGVILEDIVFYAMPFGWLGQWLHAAVVGPKLEAIFDTRKAYLEGRWNAAKSG